MLLRLHEPPRATRRRFIDTDIAILGCGLAGLSLATALVRAGSRKRITLVDARSDFTNDRTWCWWHVDGLPFSDHVAKRWYSVAVQTENGESRRFSARHPYNYLPADRFYRAALATLRGRADLQLGTRVHRTERGHDAFAIATSRGEMRAGMVFDARGLPPGPATWPLLYQSFSGWNVSVDLDAFDPETVTLMDFTVRQKRGLSFAYVLPFNRREALIEHTSIGAVPLPRAVHDEELHGYVAERLAFATTTIRRREHGVLPMGGSGRPPDAPHDGVIPIGTAGGAVRSSSGFTFVRTQVWSERIAAALVAGDLLPPLPRAARYERYDRVFLELLRRKPELAPDLIRKWFARTPPHVLERFMSDASTLGDEAAVMAGAAASLCWPG